jgi:ATP-dependent protease Clp ATPase subunit
VTFRHGDFEENTYYCAACSGWFVSNAMPDNNTTSTPSSATDPHVLHTMHHIPDENKIFTRQHRVDTNFNNTIHNPLRREQQMNQQNQSREEMYQQQQQASSAMRETITHIPTPREIMRGLNEYVIGQRNVKVALAVGVYNHYKRIFVADSAAEQRRAAASASSSEAASNINAMMMAVAAQQHNLGQFGTRIVPKSEPEEVGGSSISEPYCETPPVVEDRQAESSIKNPNVGRDVEDVEIDKSNIMLLGPTGSGKTLLVKTLARLIDVPLVITDATCLTQAGYVGEDVESILFKLYLESGQDVERCQRGIVYIDEGRVGTSRN